MRDSIQNFITKNVRRRSALHVLSKVGFDVEERQRLGLQRRVPRKDHLWDLRGTDLGPEQEPLGRVRGKAVGERERESQSESERV